MRIYVELGQTIQVIEFMDDLARIVSEITALVDTKSGPCQKDIFKKVGSDTDLLRSLLKHGEGKLWMRVKMGMALRYYPAQMNTQGSVR